jgi:hypothetical protein
MSSSGSGSSVCGESLNLSPNWRWNWATPSGVRRPPAKASPTYWAPPTPRSATPLRDAAFRDAAFRDAV